MAKKEKPLLYAKKLCFGRQVILTDQTTITPENLLDVLQDAYVAHTKNRFDIDYLYGYYLGKQPILGKVKTQRPEINMKIVQNRANAIVSFKTGYLVGKPIQYISSGESESVTGLVTQLNDMMRVEGKFSRDRELVEWQMICGLGYRMVFPKPMKGEKVPFSLYTMDPRTTFVVRANDYTRRPVMAVSYKTMLPTTTATEEGKLPLGENIYTVYTEDRIYTVRGSKLMGTQENPIGLIPIIEYPTNNARLGAFEIVLDLLDAVNEMDSGRLDSLWQFVESLLVLYNCDLDEGVTANSIREAGMILLKSNSDHQPEVKVISEVLSQSDNETLKDSLLHAINVIAGMPSQGTGNTGDSSNNAAVVLRDGWQGVETRAEEFEAMFHDPEMQMLRVVSAICSSQSSLDFDVADIDIKFTRRNYEDILSKSQTLVTMLGQDKIHPLSAYSASGLFVDTEEAYRMGMEWYEKQKAEQQAIQGDNQGNQTGNWVEGYYRSPEA